MAHVPRSAALPHPGVPINTRDQYSSNTPGYRRPDHPSRSPSAFPGARPSHRPLSPSPSPITTFNTGRMDHHANHGHHFSKAPASTPPLSPTVTFGTLQSADGTMPIKVDIQGNIDKGFFEAEGEWTCYRRNYFSCVCSYSLSPQIHSQPMQYIQSNGSQPYQVFGFAMCISAVVADNDSHTIDLVQHTPKRDKGPTGKPDKVRLHPKPSNQPGLLYESALGAGPPRMPYGAADGYPPGGHAGGDYQTEHTFERIQFKQATANNGKRRAAQQYYHLLVELWADVGSQAPDNFIKIAHRKSDKMIVRGRSPGHYQSERRGSSSSGPSGPPSNMTSYGGAHVMGGPDFSSGAPPHLGGGFGGPYDSRGMPYGPGRHHADISVEPMIPSEDAKTMDNTKEFLYFPGTIQEPHNQQNQQAQQHQQHQQQDGRASVDMFTGQRSGPEGVVPHLPTGIDPHHDRLKRDPDNASLPSLFHPGPMSQRCSPFSGKPGSEGYYPTLMPQHGVNITNIT